MVPLYQTLFSAHATFFRFCDFGDFGIFIALGGAQGIVEYLVCTKFLWIPLYPAKVGSLAGCACAFRITFFPTFLGLLSALFEFFFGHGTLCQMPTTP